jgi:two-component system cell cycle response regulator DivK
MGTQRTSRYGRGRSLRRSPGDDRGEASFTLAGLRVLVVENDANNAKLVAIVLRAEGCDVHVARSAEDALSVVPIFHPEVAVLDLVLPLMNGVQLAERLKNDTATADIVLIAVSALSGWEVEDTARAAGCAAYVGKPIDAFALPSLVLALLRPRTEKQRAAAHIAALALP